MIPIIISTTNHGYAEKQAGAQNAMPFAKMQHSLMVTRYSHLECAGLFLWLEIMNLPHTLNPESTVKMMTGGRSSDLVPSGINLPAKVVSSGKKHALGW